MIPLYDDWGSLFERRCAHCDYDLTGHPRGETICPECGKSLDESLLVLRGTYGSKRRGEVRTAVDWVRMLLVVASAMWIINSTSSLKTLLFWFAILAAITFGVEPVLRREWGFDPRHRAKLLITQNGFWQIDAEESPGERRPWMWIAQLIAVVALLCGIIVIGGSNMIGMCGGLGGGMVAATFAERRRFKLAKKNEGNQTGIDFIPWSSITKLEISPTRWLRKSDAISIRFYRKSFWISSPLVDFDWPTTPLKAHDLAARISNLAQGAERDIHDLDRLRSPPPMAPLVR